MADDINFSPDMLNNLVNMLKNNSNLNSQNNSDSDSSNNSSSATENSNSVKSSSSNNSDSSSSSENPVDFANLFSKLSSNFGSSNESNSNNSTSRSNSDSPNFNLDFETIMKMKSIMETFNDKNDPKSNLLYSLKPYLRKSKQSKLDQYVNLLKLTEISNLFKGDKK